MDQKLKNTFLRRLEIVEDSAIEIIGRLNSEETHNWEYIRENGVIGIILINIKWDEDIFSHSINLRMELSDLAETYITKKYGKEIKEILIRKSNTNYQNEPQLRKIYN